MKPIIIIAAVVVIAAVAWYFIRLAMDKTRLSRKLHLRRVEDHEHEEMMKELWPTDEPGSIINEGYGNEDDTKTGPIIQERKEQ